MDIIDNAQAIAEKFRQDALGNHKASQATGPSLTHCEDCGEEIPAPRREKVPGCSRCVDCQALLEDQLYYRR